MSKMLAASVAIAAVAAAALCAPAFAQDMAYECGPPTILLGKSGSSNGVSLVLQADNNWRVTHHLAQGDIRRQDQYWMTPLTDRPGWGGALKRNPRFVMVGYMHGGTYEEKLFDRSQGNVVIMVSVVR